MNNAWQQLFKIIILDAQSKSKSAGKGPTLFEKLMDLLQVTKLNKLHCRVIKWADDTMANADLRNYFRFTGLKSRKIGHYIYQLISNLQTDNDTRQQQLELHALSAAMVKLPEKHKRNVSLLNTVYMSNM